MKKLLLLCAAASFSLGASAQRMAQQSVLFNQGPSAMQATRAGAPLPVRVAYDMTNTNPMARKTTGGGSKWYSYFNTVDALLGNPFTASTAPTIFWAPMWFDSTVTLRYSNGVFANEIAGVCNQFDPAHYTEYNDTVITNLVNPTDIQVTPSDDYIVDSIAVRAAYIRNVARPAGIKDTLIISIAPQQYKGVYYKQSWIHNNPNVAASDTALHVFVPYYADSIHRAAFSDSAGAEVTLDTVILDPLVDGHVPDFSSGGESDTLQTYVFPIRGGAGCHIPHNMSFSVTYSFKTGDTWTPNVDSVNNFNRFCPIWGFEGTSAGATWMTYWVDQHPEYADHNGSSYMDSRGIVLPDFWFAQIASQALNNSPKHLEQYLDVQAHIKCSTCKTIREIANAVPTVANTISNISVFPNPSATEATIAFTLAQNANVEITLSNTLGQLVGTQQLGNVRNGKAVFNTSALANGVYFYTVYASGSRMTGHLVVAH